MLNENIIADMIWIFTHPDGGPYAHTKPFPLLTICISVIAYFGGLWRLKKSHPSPSPNAGAATFLQILHASSLQIPTSHYGRIHKIYLSLNQNNFFLIN